MDVLASNVPASDEEAKRALREFFSAVYELDGPRELKRLYDAFYFQCHREFPPAPGDWSDSSADGNLDAGPGLKARTATNGQ